MKKIIIPIMFILLASFVSAACSIGTPGDCTSAGTCEAVNGTWWNETCYNLKSRMVSYYSFDVDDDDEAGTSDGTITGALSHLTTGCAYGGCYGNFATNQYITADHSGKGLVSAFSYWIQDDQGITTADQGYLMKMGPGHMYIGNGWGGIVGETMSYADSITGVSAGATVLDANWHHIFVNWESGRYYVYYDGVKSFGPILSTATHTTLDSTTTFGTNGAHSSSSASKLDEVAIFNESFSQTDITALYNVGNPLNYSVASFEITVDSPENITYNISSIDFNITGSDSLDTCILSLDDYATNITMTIDGTAANYTNSSMDDGSYTALYYCNSTGGDISSVNVSFSINVPVCSVETPSVCNNQTSCEAITGTWWNNECYDMQSNMISYWQWDNGYTDAKDLNNGTANGETGRISFNCKSQTCLDLTTDGQDYVSTTVTNFANQSEERSMACWVYSSSIGVPSSTDGYFGYGGFGAEADSFEYTKSNSNYSFQGYGAALNLETGTPVILNEWFFQTITYNGTTLKIYLNNTLIGTKDMSLSTSLDSARFGTSMIGTNNDMIGYVDDCVYYNDTLTQPEIAVLFNNNTGLKYNGTNFEETLGFFIDSPDNVTYNISSIDFNITGTKDLDECIVSWNNYTSNHTMSITGDFATFTNSSMDDGSYEALFNCNATDGVRGEASIYFSVFVNDAPVIQTSRISPTPTAFSNQNLLGYCNATDGDGQDLRYGWRWYNNTASHSNGTTAYFTEGIETNVANISNTITGDGENWTLECRAFDATLYSNYLNSTSTEILGLPDFNLSIDFPTVDLSYIAVTLNYTTDADDSCWYSTDGGTINSSSVTPGQNFTGLTSVEGLNNWTVYCNNTFNVILSDTTNFRTDTIAPELTVTDPVEGTFYKNLIPIDITTSDTNTGVDKVWFYNTTDNIEYTAPTSVTMADGSYTFDFYVNDSVNNTNTTQVSFIADGTAPSLIVNSPTETNYSNGTVSINITATDTYLDTVWYDNGTDNIIYTTPTFVNLNDGSYTYTFYANDSSNNTNSTAVSFKVDTTPPVITINSPANTNYANNTILINFTATDSLLEVDKLWYFNGTDNVSYTTANNITIPDSLYTFYFYANDTVGNIAVENRTFRIDTTLPTITIDYPSEITYNNNPTELKYTTDSVEECWYSTDSGTINSSSVPTGTNFTGLTSVEGLNNWTVYCNNTFGTVGFDTNQFTVDTTGPVVTVHFPENKTYGVTTVPINFTAVDALSSVDKYWFFDGTSNVSYTTPINLGLAEGKYTLQFYANDTLGNIGESEVSFTINTTTPDITILTPTSTNYSLSPIDITYTTVADDKCWYDNGTVLSATVPAGDPILAQQPIEGANNWTMYCNNTADVTGSSSVYFDIDNTAPTITVYSPISQAYINSSILINFTGTDALNITQKYWNGTDNITYTTPIIEIVADGDHNFIFYVIDAVGNTNSTNVSFSIDVVFPVIVMHFPLADNTSTWINESPMPFNMTFSDTNLFGYNITCPGEYSVEQTGLNVTTLNFYDTYQFNTSGTRNCLVRVADDHTANNFNPKVEIKQPILGFGNRRIDINDGDIVFEFDSRNGNTLSSLSYEKKPDRISPIIELKKETKDIYWTITYKGKVFDRQDNTNIPGHIVVIPESGLVGGYWFDAESDEEIDVTYEMEDNKVKYHAISSKKIKKLKTKSIGGLNVENLTFSFDIVEGQQLTISGYDLVSNSTVPINLSLKNGTGTINYSTTTNVTLDLDCGTIYTINVTSEGYYNNYFDAFDGCAYQELRIGFWKARASITTNNVISGDPIVDVTINITDTNYSSSTVSTTTPEIIYLNPDTYNLTVSKTGFSTESEMFTVIFGETESISIDMTPVYVTTFIREQTGEAFNFVEESNPYQCVNGSELVTNYTLQEDPQSYTCGGNWSTVNTCDDAMDGIDSTFGQSNGALQATVNTTWAKPTNVTNQTQLIVRRDIIQSEVYVMEDFPACYAQPQLLFEYISNSSALTLNISCYNGTDWQPIDTLGNGGYLYDTKVRWATTINQTTSDTCENTTEINVEVEVYCPDTVLKYSINNSNPEVTGVDCEYTYWLVRPVYSTETYFRTITPPVDEIETSVYLLDLNLDEAIEIIIQLNDIASQYENGQILIYTYVNGTRVLVIQQFLDIEQRAVLWLDKWQTYEICSIDQEGVERCHGDLIADAAGTKILTLPVIPYTTRDSYAGQNVWWGYEADKQAGTLDLIYNDKSAQGYSQLVWLIKNAQGTTVNSEVRLNGFDTTIQAVGLSSEESYTTELTVEHKDITVPIEEVRPVWYAEYTTFAGWNETTGQIIKLIIAVLVPILFLFIFSVDTVEIGMTFSVITAVIFNSVGWYRFGTFGGGLYDKSYTWMSIIIVIMGLYTFLLWKRKAAKAE